MEEELADFVMSVYGEGCFGVVYEDGFEFSSVVTVDGPSCNVNLLDGKAAAGFDVTVEVGREFEAYAEWDSLSGVWWYCDG